MVLTLPKVTVLMSVHNGEEHLNSAINSIIKQTFKDFEFIIIDDHSLDKTQKILDSVVDKRIHIIRNENVL